VWTFSTGGGAQDRLSKLGFGVGLGLLWKTQGPDIVTEATIDGSGNLAVATRANAMAGFMLESHYFAWRTKSGGFGLGPFIGVQQNC
jgi:hypothetical protein